MSLEFWSLLGRGVTSGICVYFVGKALLRGLRAFARPLPRFKRSNPVDVVLGQCMCIQCQYYRKEGPAYTPAPVFDPPHTAARTYEAFLKEFGPRCTKARAGWWCSREPGHEGPCASRPI